MEGRVNYPKTSCSTVTKVDNDIHSRNVNGVKAQNTKSFTTGCTEEQYTEAVQHCFLENYSSSEAISHYHFSGIHETNLTLLALKWLNTITLCIPFKDFIQLFYSKIVTKQVPLQSKHIFWASSIILT